MDIIVRVSNYIKLNWTTLCCKGAINISYIVFDNVSKRYSKAPQSVLKDFNLRINKGEFIVIVGPSGSGKSTLLELICGFTELSSGKIQIDNELINDVLPKDRNVSMVFQNYALFPNMTVYENIEFGMKIRKNDKKQRKEKVEWAAKLLELDSHLYKKPKELSGGQRQRVALGRAIVRNPKLFLMDEPLSNLDAKLRYSTAKEITNLHRDLDATTIYVTHDQVEALTMADRIVVLDRGEIQQIGTPRDIYVNPNNVFVATFIGRPQINLFNIEYINGEIRFENKFTIRHSLEIDFNVHNEEYILGIRAENIFEDIENYDLNAEIVSQEYLGGDTVLQLKYKSLNFTMKTHKNLDYKIGSKLKVKLDLNKINLFNKITKDNIRRDRNEE